jgi:hypothetical protein
MAIAPITASPALAMKLAGAEKHIVSFFLKPADKLSDDRATTIAAANKVGIYNIASDDSRHYYVLLTTFAASMKFYENQ